MIRSTIAHTEFKYRPALDGLRAFAVLAVIAYHLDFDWAAGGFLGVDTFFVLSGFLITSLLITEHARSDSIVLSGFWSRRAKRLLPAVLLLLLAVAVYAAFVAPATALETLRGDALATLFYVANWRFILEGASYFDLFSEASPLRHMWSLAIEEQFYLVWPLVALWALNRGRGRRRLLAGVSVVALVASVLLMAFYYDQADPSRAYFGTASRMHAPLVGVVLALLLFGRRIEGLANRALQVAGVIAAVAVLWSFANVSDTGSAYYHGGSLVFAVLVAVVIAAAVQTDSSPLRVGLSPVPLRWIGAVSYGLYLWHWPMIVWLNRGRTHLDGWRLDALQIAATFAAATASYYLLERRIRFGHIPARRVAVAAPAAMLVVAVAIVGGTMGAQPSQFDIAVSELTVPPVTSPSGVTGRDTDSGPGSSSSAATSPSTEPGASSDSSPGTQADGDIFEVHTVGLIGDSVADTISWGLEPALEARGVTVVRNAFPGCGIAAGFMLNDEGQPFEWSEACLEAVPKVQEELVALHDPDVIVWHSTWEMAAREVDGEVVSVGEPAHSEALLADIDAAFQRLTAGGAKVVFLEVVPNAESDIAAAEDDSDGGFATYNRLMREYASDHPDSAVVVDLNEFLCPDGPPCPTEIDGLRMRPDGGHFVEDTSPVLAEWLAPKIIEALGADLS